MEDLYSGFKCGDKVQILHEEFAVNKDNLSASRGAKIEGKPILVVCGSWELGKTKEYHLGGESIETRLKERVVRHVEYQLAVGDAGLQA